MTTITVSVTAEHIAKGEREKCSDCPVALAIKDLRLYSDVAVGTTNVDLYHAIATSGINGYRLNVRLPSQVTSFIEAFDDGQPVSPFTFDLTLP